MGTTPFDYKSTYGAKKYKSWEGDSPWETPKDFHLRSNVSIFGDANLAAEQKVIAILESHFRFPSALPQDISWSFLAARAALYLHR